ncbi:hypothetical protein [Flavobacterium sp. DG2-3]|uniref:hypothetical protein n=1 Tax=Flavobacterium sp. DG2-3 TaxID=3068317 RepID=UPI00273F6F8C|nr:hypothetical protein [Flavobacterium sp. DG2-3]MDP5200242.1 hypothetical protein [Flavobacterium sp. DG2-3]
MKKSNPARIKIGFDLLLNACLRHCIALGITLMGFSSHAQSIAIPIEQTNPNFTLTAVRSGLGSGYESYLFYVQNNTAREYEIVVQIDLELACEGTKSFKLGVNSIVHLRANEKFTPSKDYVHNYFGNKDCAIAEGKSYTLFKSLRYFISSVVDISRENEDAAARKNAQQQQKMEAERKNQQIRKEQQDQQRSAQQERQEKLQNPAALQGQAQPNIQRQPVQSSPAEQQAQYRQKLAADRAYNAQREETINKGVSDMTNLISGYIQQNRADKERKEALEEQRALEEQQRQYELSLKISGRKNAFQALPGKDIPLASQEKAPTIYYFIYSHNGLESEYGASAYVSNVFEVGRYNDGTRAYTATVKNEIAGLTPYPETLHGYYYTLDQAEQKRSELIGSLQNYGVMINYITYKGKPGAAGAAQTIENQGPNYGSLIEKPAKADLRPADAAAPKTQAAKSTQKKPEKNYGTIIE